MENKKTGFGTLVLILVFGMVVVGCSGRSIDGIWVDTDDDSVHYTFNNGNFDFSVPNVNLFVKGTYTIDRNELTTITTHVSFDGNEFEDTQTMVGTVKGNRLVMTSENDGEIQTYTYIRRQDNTSNNRIGKNSNVKGSWTGNIQGYVTTIVLTDSEWTIAVPALQFSENGNYIRTGDNAVLKSSRGVEYGTATLVNKNTISITLNRNTDFSGTYTLNKQ